MTTALAVCEPRPTLSPDERSSVFAKLGTVPEAQERLGVDGVSGMVIPKSAPKRLPGRLHTLSDKIHLRSRLAEVHNKQRAEASGQSRYARIVAIIPTFEQENEIDKSVESLLLQSRPIDAIVVIVNGPGESADAMNRLWWLANEFPERLKVAMPPSINGRDMMGKSNGSKVGALNWAYREFVMHGDFDFVLGMDADVVADHDMVHQLELDALRYAHAGGVRARYSFKPPSNMEGKSASLIAGQRHEFTKKEIDDALHGRAHILGGQATLFDVAALKKAAQLTNGYVPWSDDTLVEDAELTRVLEKLDYHPRVSCRARAWTGLMFTAYTWQKQRRKWQDGHLIDMTKDFHPWQDRRRWREQFALGWNLLLRVLFAVVLATSVALDRFRFSPLWLVPLGVVAVQSYLIALKTPNRSLREIIRALLYIPGEVYYLRTLSVWLDSFIFVILNISRDGWANQVAAESGQKKTAISGWILILTAVAVPTAGLLTVERFIAPDIMGTLVTYGWWTVSAMTILSVLSMLWFIVRVLRRWRTLCP